MPLRLIEANEENRPLFERLLQLYLHDVSEFSNAEPHDDGLYCYRDCDDFWSDENKFPFLFMLRGKPAGIILIKSEALNSGATQYEFCDLFVLKCYRRLGIGEEIARMVFGQYQGRWQIRVVEQNDVARSFWRQVMRRYTFRRYRELRADADGGVLFEFDSPTDTASV